MDEGADQDSNASSRIASGSNETGNTGDAISSLQTYTTRRPDNNFSLSERIKSGGKTSHGGRLDSGKRIRYHDGTRRIPATGGDSESRPVNIHVHYLIKELPNTLLDPLIGQVPVGGVISLHL
ncbi:hypothetical protein [Breoghania sp.]|uniref:hypothetical protein n=1 Tax=Breoghania sp. TaxID=2065378 RepID=UPI002633C610|nr:hypothetical protein [Breoghania sp.]MDJ0933691.1 hypothetical protein [Breoghania sp.]